MDSFAKSETDVSKKLDWFKDEVGSGNAPDFRN